MDPCLSLHSKLARQSLHCPVTYDIYITLQQQVEGLTKRKAELQAESQKPSLGPDDQRAVLLAKVKADNEACETASQKAKQATEAIRQLERQGVTAQPTR